MRTLSACERQSVISCVGDGLRFDARKPMQFRPLCIHFGRRYGTCEVQSGNTRVLATITASLVPPTATHSHEGRLHVDVSIAPTAGGDVTSERRACIERLLERCVYESRCVDLEVLCVTVDECVWQIQAHIHVLQYSGACASVCSVALLAALLHFRWLEALPEEHRGTQSKQRSLAVLHTPFLVTFAFFDDQSEEADDMLVADPTLLEEAASYGVLTVGVNTYRELCATHLDGGHVHITEAQLLHCVNVACVRAAELMEAVREALEADSRRRGAGTDRLVPLSRLCVEETSRQAAISLTAAVTHTQTLPPQSSVTRALTPQGADGKAGLGRTLMRHSEDGVLVSVAGDDQQCHLSTEFLANSVTVVCDNRRSAVKIEEDLSMSSDEEVTTMLPEQIS